MENKPNENPQEADLQERINGFNKELPSLLGKYELGIAAMAKILPDGRTVADPIIISMRKQIKKEEATPPKVEGGLANPDA